MFFSFWKFKVSEKTIARCLFSHNVTKKVIERRALEIRFDDVLRFENEVNSIFPVLDQLLFLDEMSTDNRAMLRKKGYFLRNQRPVFRGIFRRGKRISILAFLAVDSLVEVYQTDGTFDRHEFFGCVKKLIASGRVRSYPGPRSVWILDGASIHLSASMIDYLWLSGIVVIFLPAYCPFFNPIEILFGLVKRRCRALKKEKDFSMTDEMLLWTVLGSFIRHDFGPIFETCGYSAGGRFDRHINFDHFDELREGR